MNALDFNIFDPRNYRRGTVGFDEMFKKLESLGTEIQKIQTYPPYNIKKTGDNTYVIEMAVAGFSKQDIELTLENGVLKISGSLSVDDGTEYFYKGISERAFSRKFTLADNVEIKNADLINGMLKIWLEHIIPESKKLKKIEINESANTEIKKLNKE